MEPRKQDTRERLRGPVAILVSLVWAISALIALYNGDVRVFIAACAPFSFVLGWLFGIKLVSRAENGDES